VWELFTEQEQRFSRFKKGSELSMINTGLGNVLEISSEMAEVLKKCLELHGATDKYFDPRIFDAIEHAGYVNDFKSSYPSKENVVSGAGLPIENRLEDDVCLDYPRRTVLLKRKVDTSGIVKGYAIDQAADILKKNKIESFLVDAGGDMYVYGDHGGKDYWSIGIEGVPDDKIILKIKNAGLATSGITRRRWMIGSENRHHIINPKKPSSFSTELKTVTVISEQTAMADGLAKSLFLMGKVNGLMFANEYNLKAVFLDYKGNIYVSEKIKENL
jgi:thiamine biosynthesis lipoprotein